MKKLLRSIAVLSISAAMLFCDVGALGAAALGQDGAAAKSGKVIDAAPPVPSVTEFNTVDWDAGWYRMETDLEMGECIYTIDYDTVDKEYETLDHAEDYMIKTLPDKYLGSDYILSRCRERQYIFFRAEQDIYVYAAVDDGYTTSNPWLTGWTDTGDRMETNDGHRYRIYERAYEEGLVYIRALGDSDDGKRNFFLMVLPQEGEAVSNALTDNPVVPEGTVPADAESADDDYAYYVNDVFTQGELPASYEAYGVTAENTAAIEERAGADGHAQYSLLLEKNDWQAAALGVKRELETPAEGKIVVEARVKTDGKSRSMEIPGLYDASGARMAFAEFGTNGYIQANGVDLVPYNEGVWYPVRIVADTQARTYDVWVDHLLKGENIPFEGGTGAVASVAFAAAEESEGALDIDYLRVFDYTEIYVLEEDFNKAQTGSVPSGWSVSGSAAVAEFPFPEDKSLKLEGAGASAQYAFDALRGDVTVEAKVRPVQSSWVTAPLVTDASGKVAVKVALYRNSIFICNGNNWVYICDQEVPNNYYGCDNWFDIKVVLNTYTNRYDFYVDGAKRYTGASLAEDVDEVSRIAFTAEEANTLYVDNVKVYDADSYARHMLPQENVYNVKDYGAKGDGVTDDTEAINAAIEDAAYTGGTVLLEDGVFYSGQIVLRSDMTLFIDTSATLFANMDRNIYDKVIPSNGYNGNKQLGRGIIWFEDEKNVRITGGGTIFGNGFYGFGENDPSNQRPCVIYFASCEDVVIENLNIVQSPFWTLVPYESSGITVRNVNITNHVAPNRDGIDPVNSSNMTVENCKVIAGDDAFCPKSGNQIPSRNVEVRNCFFQSYCNGIKFGTDAQGPFSNYVFEDIYMKGVGMSGIALEAVDGSDMEYLTFRRIEMTDVDNAMFAAVGNRMRTPYGVSDPAEHKKLGSIGNILIDGMRFTNCMQWPYSHKNEDTHEILLYGLNPSKNTLNDGKDHRIYNVLFRNVYLEMPGGKTEVPEFDEGLGSQYPEHGELGDSVGYAYTIRWADNVQFENCTSVVVEPDVREEVGISDYRTEEVTVQGIADFVLGLDDIVVTESLAAEQLPLPSSVPVRLVTGQVIDVAVAEWQAADAYKQGETGVYEFIALLAEDGRAAGTEGLRAYVRVVVEEPAADDTQTDEEGGGQGGANDDEQPSGGCSSNGYAAAAAVSLPVLAGAAVLLHKKRAQR